MTGSGRNGVADRFAERAVGERGESVGGPAVAGRVADPELVERPSRRRFTAEYKLRIVREWEACTVPGSVGALLRREGLYTSHLSAWRQQRDTGALEGLGRARGRKPADRRDLENEELGAAVGAEAGRDPAVAQGDRDPGKRFSALGADARNQGRGREHRAMICQTVDELTPLIGTRPACRALGASPATVYRRRSPSPPRPSRPRPTPARALDAEERVTVLDVLHSDRFVDGGPGRGVRHPPRRRPVPLLGTDEVPAARWCPRAGAGTPRPAHPPRLHPSGAACDRAERAVVVGYLEAEGPGQVDLRTTCT